ncbi:MAG: GTPase HflX [Terriglobales bacterium]
METAFLVAVQLGAAPAPGARAAAASGALDFAPAASAQLAELRQLTESAGAHVAGELSQRRAHADPATLIGKGKLEELEAAARGVDLVIFDNDLSPTQQRNLEQAIGVRVLARTQLILDIFARHARSREGQLQVELAQLDYLLPRLAGRGTALSRLGGGIGTRGPGETQLETDRRRIRQRIATLRRSMERIRRQRDQQRQRRASVPLPVIALVGYTNAGKSTLFNRLTGATVLTSPRMFATLDPTLRSLRLPSRRNVLLSDTVGFVRDLPPGLVNAFRATLEEVTRASLLAVVADATAPQRERQLQQVQQVLRELGVADTPQVQIWNKADRLGDAQPPAATEGANPLLVSAATGAGLEQLLATLDRQLSLGTLAEVQLRIPHPAGRWLHVLHERGQILHQHHAADEVELLARVPQSLLASLGPFLAARKR